MLIINDIVYPKKSEEETSVLFEIIDHHYEIRSILITTNQTFSEREIIFADATMTVAAIDHLVHYALIIEIQTQSFRQKTTLARSTSFDNSNKQNNLR